MNEISDQPTTKPSSSWGEAVAGVAKAFVPGSIKALDRLLGAAVDIPVALLGRSKARIEAQTKSFELVEGTIGQKAAEQAGMNAELVDRAVNVLASKNYRQYKNREVVARLLVKDLREAGESDSPDAKTPEDDWLNVFERYVEDASSERMQSLWARVLSGEIRKPGSFSLRALRFLSELSQSDAELFSELSALAFGTVALRKLVVPSDDGDLTKLMQLEAAGLIQNVAETHVTYNFKFNAEGFSFVREDDKILVLKGEPGVTFSEPSIMVTPLGVEMLGLIADRDVSKVARTLAESLRNPNIQACFFGELMPNKQVIVSESFW